MTIPCMAKLHEAADERPVALIAAIITMVLYVLS